MTSIGHYINPPASVLFGIALFRERISGHSRRSASRSRSAAIGIVLMTYQLGKLPWAAVVLAVSVLDPARRAQERAALSIRSQHHA